MMQSFIPFLQVSLLLFISGSALALLLLPRATLGVVAAFGLPLGALLNVLTIFALTIVGAPLTFATVFGGHLAIIAILIAIMYRKPVVLMDLERPSTEPKPSRSRFATILLCLSITVIAMNAMYSVSHAIILPSAQYDSATNWTMRSQISFVDQRIAFDPTEIRGMAKPQYPFLFHALQITANQGQQRWNDRVANTILWLLSLSSFAGMWLLVRKRRGTVQATTMIALIMSIPLVCIHMAQGYGDINLLQYFLLSAACLGMWVESTHHRRDRWLVLSAIFVAASVWAKSEGIVFGLVPWLLTVGVMCRRNAEWKSALPAIAVAILIAAPWPIFAMLKGLSLTPHSSDTMLVFHSEGVKEVFHGMFGRGSFGTAWYALLVLVPLLLIDSWKKNDAVIRRLLPLLLWGGMMILEILFIYLTTPNVRFLMNGESFYRQMMIPAAMLVTASAFIVRLRKSY